MLQTKIYNQRRTKTHSIEKSKNNILNTFAKFYPAGFILYKFNITQDAYDIEVRYLT